jgi:hypothetical protein
MPLLKHLFGRQILATRRDGGVIHVKLAAETQDAAPQRMTVTTEFYARNRKCRYLLRQPGATSPSTTQS